MKLKYFGNEEKLRKQQIELISLLNQWYQVREDIIYAFEKCAESDLSEPTKSNVNNLITRIRGGVSAEKALEMFGDTYPDKSFKYFIKQITFNMKYRGNTGELLDNLETQFIKIDEEYSRRKIESSHDRIVIASIFIFSPVMAILIFIANPLASELFLRQPIGNLIGIAALIAFGIGYVIFIAAGKTAF